MIDHKLRRASGFISWKKGHPCPMDTIFHFCYCNWLSNANIFCRQNSLAARFHGLAYLFLLHVSNLGRGCRGRDRMVVGFIITYAISAYHHWCEFESRSGGGVQHYEIKFVSDLRHVSGFLRVLRFPPPIELTTMI